MKETACTVIGLYLTEISVIPAAGPCPLRPRFSLRLPFFLWRHRGRLLAELSTSLLAAAILSLLYFVCATLFLLQLATHGW